jgi:hypothetical protein
MPRVSRCNPVHDGTHDGNEEPPKSTSRKAKKTTLPTTKCTTTKGAASAKTRPVSTKSANSKGNKIAGTPNKRGKQIVSSSATRNSPRGRSPSQDLGIEDRSIAESLHSTRKAPPETSATSKEQGDTGNAIVADSLMAAAASTLLYQLQYDGGDDGKYASDHSDASDDLCASLDDDKDYKPNGLAFSDDDDFLIDIDYESEDEQLQSSFPKNKLQMNIIPGGPEPPDLSKYPESEQDAVLAAYLVKRKAFTDRDRHRRMKKSKLEAKLSGTVSGAQIE